MVSLISGEADLADVLFLIAVILFGIAAFLSASRRSEEAYVRIGLALVALAWLVL